MKKILIFILFILAAFRSNAQTANAGTDQTVVFPTTSVTIGGASSATSYLWTKIYDVQQPQATYPADPATIVSPTSATTSVTGLIQGVWYYRIAATTGATTVYDTVVVRVDYYTTPTNTTLFQTANFAAMAPQINARNLSGSYTDTTVHIGVGECRTYTFGTSGGTSTSCPVAYGNYNATPFGTNTSYIFRDLIQLSMIDNSRGKYYESVRDGVGGYNGGSGFNELQGTNTSANNIDSNYTYIFEWKGYLPHLSALKSSANLGGKFIFENHPPGSCGGCSGAALSFEYLHDSLCTEENCSGGNGTGSTDPGIIPHVLYPGTYGGDYILGFTHIDSFYNIAHTVRIVMREGVTGTERGGDAFVKVEVDGKQVYLRNTGQVGQAFQADYPMTGGIYDHDANFCSPTNTSRGRQVSAVLEAWNAYKVTGSNTAPISTAGSNQTLGSGATTTNLNGTGWDADGYIKTYAWTKTSGTGSITSSSSATTGLTGLTGASSYLLTTTDNQGATGTSAVTVTVGSSYVAPTVYAGNNQTLASTATSTTLLGSGTGTGITYAWTKTSGAACTITSPTSATTGVTGLAIGDYRFLLTVTDSASATATDTVHITVNPTPTANAGSNQTLTVGTTSTTLSGSGTGAGIIYSWSQTGGTTCTIASPTSATTSITGLVGGISTFLFTVIDNTNATATSSINITVNTSNLIIRKGNHVYK